MPKTKGAEASAPRPDCQHPEKLVKLYLETPACIHSDAT